MPERDQLSASLSALPGRNFGTLAALILMGSLVRGLRPLRAARLLTLKVPKPTSETVVFFFRLVFTPPIMASRARDAAAFEMSACLAMCSMSSVLFTNGSPSGRLGVSKEFDVASRGGMCGSGQNDYIVGIVQCQAGFAILWAPATRKIFRRSCGSYLTSAIKTLRIAHRVGAVSYTHLRAHETVLDLV